MTSISAFLTPDHHHCDTLFAAAESPLRKGTGGGGEAWARFQDALRTISPWKRKYCSRPSKRVPA